MTFFNREGTASNPAVSSEITVISEGLTISGEITATDNVYINGTFIGKISAHGEISIGPKGRIEGEVAAASLRVSGYIDGKIECTSIAILPTGKVLGNLSSEKLEIHSGGYLFAEHRVRKSVDKQAPAQAKTTEQPPSPPADIVDSSRGNRQHRLGQEQIADKIPESTFSKWKLTRTPRNTQGATTQPAAPSDSPGESVGTHADEVPVTDNHIPALGSSGEESAEVRRWYTGTWPRR